MSQILPWYSSRRGDRNVYHDNDQCPEGKEIEEKYRKNGRRCRPRCPACAKLQMATEQTERLAKLSSF